MLWRSLSLVRAWSAAGLLSLMTFGVASADEPTAPLPGRDAQAESVRVLDGQKSGDLSVDARGRGQAQVHLSIKNNSGRRLNVILPPGLVAASTVGQGLQNMGLGAPNNKPGGFGQFQNQAPGVGFRSVAPAGEIAGVPVSAGQTVELDLPAVCLNFGLPSPAGKDKLSLMDVDDYSKDARVRTALRTLALLGTSQGTAQAAMWNVCNNVSFPMMMEKGEKVANRHEVALAARFVEALDAAGTGVALDPAQLTEARLFVTVVGEGKTEKDARRLATDLEGLRVMGLPVRVLAAADLPKASAPALHVVVSLGETKVGETNAKVVIRGMLANDVRWTGLAQTAIKETSSLDVLTGADLARSIDKAVASSLVVVKTAKRSTGSTTFRIENRLPFTLASVSLKAGNSPGAPVVSVPAVGIGPGRFGSASIQAPTASIDRVELNGL